ncbi:MAG: hypothetical protein NC094_01660 [Bacteroidales bacterium]|nr:hypothetical protein [Lachnoclostridium sp.]MCM1385416.1 hypothetical protein [Lachnoclostridium sp.]MCM1464102.1 hypothetical protein [Bacteroidales bacterium]
MKNFSNYEAQKYVGEGYQMVEEGIYKTKSPYRDEEIYVTSLSFELEPECYGEEEGSPQYIPQIPFENLLDEFWVYVTDFYEDLNQKSEKLCYQEFGGSLSDIQKLRTIIGKRFYAMPYEEDGEEYSRVVIE